MDHSPADLQHIYSVAVSLKQQLLELLATRPHDPALLPLPRPLLLKFPRRMHRNVARASAARMLMETEPDPCPFSPTLRTDPLRREVLAEWKELIEGHHDIRDRNQAASRLLKKAMTRLYGEKIGQACAHHTTRIAARKERTSVQKERAKAFMGADKVPVEALCKLKIDSTYRQPGERFHVGARAYLLAASSYARTFSKRNGPIYTADGTSLVARRARLCWQVMSAIGTGLHPGPDGKASRFVRLTTVVQQVTGHKGGKRYAEIAALTDDLVAIGFAKWSTREGPRAVRLLSPK